MPSIYGGLSNPFGAAPYGLNINSNSSYTSTGGLWGDDNVVWNLNDSSGLVQSLPETKSYLNSMGLGGTPQYGLQYNGLFAQSPLASGSNYYNSLLAGTSSGAGSGTGMNDLMSFMMLMQKMNLANKVEKEKNDPTKKATKFDDTELEDFVKNKNTTSKLEYGDIDKFAADLDSKLRKEKKHVTVDDAFKLVGIDVSKMSKDSKRALEEKINFNTGALDDPKEHYIGKDVIKAILEGAGMTSDKSSITRQELQDGIKSLKKGETKSDDSSPEDHTDDVESVDSILNKSKPTADDRDELKKSIKGIAKDKDALKAFLKSAAAKDDPLSNGKKGVNSRLAGIFTTLSADDSEEGLADYQNILKTLKAAAHKNKLDKEWDAALSNTEADKSKMDDSLGWGNSDEKSKLATYLKSAKL